MSFFKRKQENKSDDNEPVVAALIKKPVYFRCGSELRTCERALRGLSFDRDRA